MNDETSSRAHAGAAVELPPSPARLFANPIVQGLVWMIASGFLFGILNTTQKVLTHQMHPPQVVCLRYLVGSLLLIPFIMHAGWAAYRPRRFRLHVYRGGFHVAGALIWFTVLPYVTLAQNSAIGFTGPIFMMLGAWLFFGEKMYAARWAAVAIAFAGVLIVLWPGLVNSDIGSFYSMWLLLSSPLFAGSFLISKTLTRYDTPEAIVFWLGIMMGVMSIPFAIWSIAWSAEGIVVRHAFEWPTAMQWGLLIFAGLVGSSAHYCMTRAYHITDVSAVQPVRFLDLVWASLFGFVVFTHMPTMSALIGGSIICGATLWIARRESRRRAP
jgi:drug/metabolite transporter (DMT)-like permease